MAKSKRIKRWPVVQEVLEVPEKSFIPILKETLQEPAIWFHQLLIEKLKRHTYPLRRGRIGESQSESGQREDDTSRLWPGDKSLWEMQTYSIRKVTRELAVRISHYNMAEHAKYFFKEIEPHPIAAPMNSYLKFWAGIPLPWHPPFDNKKPGKRKIKSVAHPGHLDYSVHFYNLEKTKRDLMIEGARDKAVDKWLAKLGE